MHKDSEQLNIKVALQQENKLHIFEDGKTLSCGCSQNWWNNATPAPCEPTI